MSTPGFGESVRRFSPVDGRVAWGHAQAAVRATANFSDYGLLAVLFYLLFFFFSVDFPSGSAPG